MSTKTLRKRIALVAVSALGFGFLTSVVPAYAAGSLSVSIVDVNASATGGADAESDLPNATDLNVFRSATTDIAILVSRVGLVGTVPVTLMFSKSPDAQAPVGTAITADVANNIAVATTSNISFNDVDGQGASPDDGNAGSSLNEIYTVFQLDEDTINVTGDYAGTVWFDADGDSVIDADEVQTTFDFTIGGTPDTATLAFSPSTVWADRGANTVAAIATFYDEDDNLTALAADDDLEIESTAAFSDEADIVDSTDFTRLANGSYNSGLVLSPNTAAAYTAIVLNFDDAGDGTFETELTATAAITIRTKATDPSSVTLTTTAGIDFDAAVTDDGILSDADATEAISLDPAVVTSLSFKIAGDAGDYVAVVVAKPAADAATNVTAATNYVRIGSDGLAYLNVAASGGVDGKIFTVTVTDATADFVYTFTYADAAPVLTVDVEGSYKSAISSAQAFKVRIRDQYAVALAGTRVTATVTGRNPAVYSGLADASGYVNFTWTDSGAAVGTTTATSTDTVTFSATDATSVERTVTYSTSGPAVATVTITDDEADNAISIDPSEAIAGLPADYVTYTVRVLDATGAPISGVRVSMSGSADDLFILGDSVGVTASTGETTINAYRRVAGFANVSATAGAVSASDLTPVKWSAVSSGARYVTLTTSNTTAVAQGIIRATATVTDRWGNAVPLANVTLVENGAGRLYSGETASKTTTLGVATWDLTSLASETGSNTLTVTVTDVDVNDNGTVAAGEGLAQIDDLAGYIGTTAVAGLAAGVARASATVEFTVDKSTSTADALLALAQALGTKDQATAAVEAAAEANDAANAATDSANAAAEAADAATAAAQDAADAVAALSTQVSEMIAALKKQITSLTNLVIKIQKKVKA
jgi:hypothetical protein